MLGHQLNQFVKSAKLLRERVASELSVRTQSTNKDRVNPKKANTF